MNYLLRGKSGCIVGLPEYFEQINRDNYVGRLFGTQNGVKYYDQVKKIANKTHNVFDEILSDLQSHIKMVRYIEERDRENLANFVSGLYAVCNLVGSETGSGNRCLAILQLFNYKTESGASNLEVEIAAKDVIDGGPFSMFRSERIDLL